MGLNNRYDFVLAFDVKDGNPNGDPDAGNLPRVDPETGRGLVTDVCIKRKIRNYVGLRHGEQPPYEIYIKEKAVLNNQNARAYKEIKLTDSVQGDKKRKVGDKVDEARKWMCQNFYDVRTFGAVMSTGLDIGVNCGQVRGPVQLTFARSVDPVVTSEHSITRMAVTTEAEEKKQEGGNRTMGRKFTIPYGLYVTHGFISAHLAEQTGFGEEDLELLFEALNNMFEHDRSAARGEMTTRGLYVFKHDSKLGNAHAHDLFSLVQFGLKKDVSVPRDYSDYSVSVSKDKTPPGVQLIEM
ncbi:MAG: type I-C CRISPR-associated protein Cas7/Csd2 [Leptospirales bacterium]